MSPSCYRKGNYKELLIWRIGKYFCFSYPADVILNKVESKSDINFGFDALTNTYVNMIDSGIVDPVKVTRTALESAASVAGLLLTTECIIGIKDEPEQPSMQQPMNQMM